MSTPNNTIDDLRAILFDTMRGLKNGSIDIERAKAISDTAQTIVNVAKVEVDHARITGASGSRFLGAPDPQAPEQTPKGTTVEPIPGGRKITHRLGG